MKERLPHNGRKGIHHSLKKTGLFLAGIVFFLLGLVGLLLPIVPQIPFFIAGCLCLAAGSERFRRWFTGTGFYTRHVAKFVRKHEKLADFLNEKQA